MPNCTMNKLLKVRNIKSKNIITYVFQHHSHFKLTKNTELIYDILGQLAPGVFSVYCQNNNDNTRTIGERRETTFKQMMNLYNILCLHGYCITKT